LPRAQFGEHRRWRIVRDRAAKTLIASRLRSQYWAELASCLGSPLARSNSATLVGRPTFQPRARPMERPALAIPIRSAAPGHPSACRSNANAVLPSSRHISALRQNRALSRGTCLFALNTNAGAPLLGCGNDRVGSGSPSKPSWTTATGLPESRSGPQISPIGQVYG
jgi:hypothetical protein